MADHKNRNGDELANQARRAGLDRQNEGRCARDQRTDVLSGIVECWTAPDRLAQTTQMIRHSRRAPGKG